MLLLDNFLTWLLITYSSYKTSINGGISPAQPATFYTFNERFRLISEAGLKTLPIEGKVCFVIHGMYQDISQPIYHSLAEAFVKSEKCMVIGLEWLVRDYDELFFIAAGYRAKNTGQYLSSMICSLGIDPDNVHIAGFSVGAHIAAHAGRHYQRTCGKGAINRITGLDPERYGFVGNSDALGPTDAKTVAVVHTDTVFGLWKSCGTHDFFAGSGVQFGCPVVSILDVFSVPDTMCSHQRSTKYFAESMSGGSMAFVGRGTAGACQLRGGELNCPNGSYNFYTRSTPPYAIDPPIPQ